MVVELDPPTVFMVGEVAIPPKSPANCTLPFTVVDASGVAAVVVDTTKEVVANCVLLVPAAAVGAVGTPVNATSTIVLFVKVSVPAKVAIVPVVGSVILVSPILVKVVLKFPTVVKSLAVKILPPSVMVLLPLFTPVPPKVPAIACVKLELPSNALPYIFLVAANFVAVLALPVKSPVTLPVNSAVIFPALKFPLASLFTMVLAVFASVEALANNSAVCMVEELEPPTVFTIGDAAIPLKSPANCIFPLEVVVASGVAAVIAASTKSLTDFTVGYFVLEVPSAFTSVLLLEIFSLYPNLVIKVAVSAIRAPIFTLLSIIADL